LDAKPLNVENYTFGLTYYLLIGHQCYRSFLVRSGRLMLDFLASAYNMQLSRVSPSGRLGAMDG
jgi:hypothetical protein